MKIGILSQWFDPETGPASLSGTYAREMDKLGHEIKVLTGFPNYPTGKIYPGFRQSIKSTTRTRNVSVTRVPLLPSHDGSAIGRIANYLSFAASASTLGAGVFKGVDAIWVYNSPPTITLPLMLHSRFGHVPYFLHIQDLWPESLIESGMLRSQKLNQFIIPMIEKIVATAERKAAVVGVISPSVRKIILDRNPELTDKIVYAPNPANEDLFRPVQETRKNLGIAPDPDYFTIIYAGAIGEAQGLADLVEAADKIQNTHPHVRIRIAGDGNAKSHLELLVAKFGLKNIDFLGRIEESKIPELIAKADACLVSLAPAKYLQYTTPSKIASLLASGTPIIGHIAGDGAELLNHSGAGIVSNPGNVEELAQSISQLSLLDSVELDRMGANGLKFYRENLSRNMVTKNIVNSLEKVRKKSKD